MHQSTTTSLSETIWPRWALRQFLSLPIVQTLLSVTFGYSLSSEAVVMRQLRRWKRLWRRSLTRSHKRISMGPSRSCWNGTTSALQPEEINSKGISFMRVLSINVAIRKSLETYLMITVLRSQPNGYLCRGFNWYPGFNFWIKLYTFLCTNILGNGMNPFVIPAFMWKIVGQTMFYDFAEAASLGKGKLNLKNSLILYV